MLTKNENPKRIAKASSKPILIEFSEDYYDLDPVLRQLKKVMIKDTANNREFAFWNDSISVSFTEITSAIIIGEGLKVKSENKNLLKVIEDFNKKINVNDENIEDWMRYAWYDEIVHGKSFWRIAENPKYNLNVDIQRIDSKTLLEVKDPKEGWKAFIQSVPDYKSHESKLAFYRNVKSTDIFNYSTKIYPLTNNILPKGGYRHITIPDEPNVLLRTQFFLQPPITPALHFITHKRWTVYFMRKFAQKHWAPFLLASVGDPKTNFYPDSPEQMDEEIAKVSNVLPRVSNWGGVAHAGNVTIKALDTGGSKSADIYKDAIDILDQQIMYSIFASMALRSASGTERTTHGNLMDSFYTFIENIRRKFINRLERFYVKCLLPANGITAKEDEFSLEFGSLRKMGYLENAQAIERLNIAGVFKDDNEVRRSAQMLFDWLKPLPEGENKKREYTSPSEIAMEQAKQPAMGLGGGSKPKPGSSQKNPQNKRASAKGT